MPKAYLFDENNYFTEEVDCPIDPLESELKGYEVFIQPADSTSLKPLDSKDGFKVKFDKENDSWEYEEIKKEEEVQPYVPTEKDKIQAELWTVKGELQSLDYIGIKIATGRATAEEYAEEIQTMNKLAEQVNALEKQIEDLDD